MNDIENYDRYFIAEVLERNGDMEYNDKSSFCVPLGDSLERTVQEFHLNWRNELDEDWAECYGSWEEYYNEQTDNEKGAYWSDHTLVFYPNFKETTQTDIQTKESIENWWGNSRCNYADMYNTAELYLIEAARFLAKDKDISSDEAMEEILYSLQS